MILKRLITGLFTTVLIVGIATTAFAHGNNNDNEGNTPNSNFFSQFSFEEMIPFMKEMHPNFEDEDFEQMYRDHHGTEGQPQPQNSEGSFDQMPHNNGHGHGQQQNTHWMMGW